MKEKELKLLNYQILTSIFFIISIIISIISTFDEKQQILKRKRLFSEKFDKHLNLFNRILALTITIVILYINYEYYKINEQKRSNLAPFRHQIYASIFSLISALIVLYVVIENWYENPNITNIENPTI